MTNYNKEKILGRVKWFNSKLGYGFITHTNNHQEECDVFVHWSNLILSEKEFHTLYKGEYVEFELESCTCNSNTVGVQACSVSGPNNTPLLTTTHGDFSTYTHNINRFSHVFNVRQLPISEFSNPDNFSKKTVQYYQQNI
jgi:cold shock CspA family protein